MRVRIEMLIEGAKGYRDKVQINMREELIKFVLKGVDATHEQGSCLIHTRQEAENWIDEYLNQKDTSFNSDEDYRKNGRAT